MTLHGSLHDKKALIRIKMCLGHGFYRPAKAHFLCTAFSASDLAAAPYEIISLAAEQTRGCRKNSLTVKKCTKMSYEWYYNPLSKLIL